VIAALATAWAGVSVLQQHGVLPGGRAADAATGAGPPPFVVTVDGSDDIQVQATATGRVTDRVPPPPAVEGEELNRPAVVAAAADSVRFAVAYGAQGAPIRIYTFSLTRIGRVTGLAPIRGGFVPDLVGYRLAVSADGSKLAISGSPERPYGSTPSPQIIVIDAATGRHRLWRGGLRRPGEQASILSLSWRSGARDLVFAVQWCRPLQAEPYSYACAGSSKDPPAPAVAQIRQITVRHGGTLAASTVLLRFGSHHAALAQAIINMDGDVALLLVGKYFSVERVSLSQSQVTSRAAAPRRGGWGIQPNLLTADGSGRYLLVALDDGAYFGWISQHHYHRLPDENSQLTSAAW